jgi:hypothetical protein
MGEGRKSRLIADVCLAVVFFTPTGGFQFCQDGRGDSRPEILWLTRYVKRRAALAAAHAPASGVIRDLVLRLALGACSDNRHILLPSPLLSRRLAESE